MNFVEIDVGWFYWYFTALQHILCHFGCGQLTQPHCSWASLQGSLPVLNAHSFASNWQLPFLNQRKGENGRRIFSWPNLNERMFCRTWGSNPRPSAYQADAHLIELPRMERDVRLYSNIQLLTIEALNMMWYPPENTNIDRGDSTSYSMHQQLFI